MTSRLDPGAQLLRAGPDCNPGSRSGVELVHATNSPRAAVGSQRFPRHPFAWSDDSSAHLPGVPFEPVPPKFIVVCPLPSMASCFDPLAPLYLSGSRSDQARHADVEPVYAATSVGTAVSFVRCPAPASSLSWNSSACDPVRAFVLSLPADVVVSRICSMPMLGGPIAGAPRQLATVACTMIRRQLCTYPKGFPRSRIFRQLRAFAYGLACDQPVSPTRLHYIDRCASLAPRWLPPALTRCRAGSNYNGRLWHHASLLGRCLFSSSFRVRIRQHRPRFMTSPVLSQNQRYPCGSASLARSSGGASCTRSNTRFHTPAQSATRTTLSRSAPASRSVSSRSLNEKKTARRSRMGFVCKSGSQSAAGAFSRERN